MKTFLPEERFQYGCMLNRIVFRVEILFSSEMIFRVSNWHANPACGFSTAKKSFNL